MLLCNFFGPVTPESNNITRLHARQKMLVLCGASLTEKVHQDALNCASIKQLEVGKWGLMLKVEVHIIHGNIEILSDLSKK